MLANAESQHLAREVYLHHRREKALNHK